jgi:hypothetical protein
MQNYIKVVQRFFEQTHKAPEVFKAISREKKIIGVVVIVLSIFLLYQSLLSDRLMKIKALNFRLASQTKLLDYYVDLQKNSEVFLKRVTDLEASLADVKKKFVLADELSTYFTNFRQLITNQNIEIISLDFLPQEGIKDDQGNWLQYFLKQPFDVSMKGDYLSIMTLLYKLEAGSTLFDIVSINLRSEGSDSYNVVMDIKAAVYILTERNVSDKNKRDILEEPTL